MYIFPRSGLSSELRKYAYMQNTGFSEAEKMSLEKKMIFFLILLKTLIKNLNFGYMCLPII